MNERWLWTQKEDIGPSPRLDAAIAYEGARQRVVLFGGYNSFRPQIHFGDTWEWDGDAWTQIADTGPSERAFLPMVFDSSRECLVLFRGTVVGGWLGDTWELSIIEQ